MDPRTQPRGLTRPQGRSWRRVLLLVAFALTVLAAGLVWFEQKEPTCRGKRLSEWLERCMAASDLDETKSAEAAIRQIGADGLPFLLRWMRHEPRSGKGILQKLV